jgi:hypothetical protein
MKTETTESARVAGWLGWSLVCLGLMIGVYGYGCAGTSSIRHGDTLDVSSYPPDMRAAYKVFSVRCSRCHTLARPLNARIHDPRHWERYVARMRLNPASGINAKNGDIIIRFLVYYMQQRQAAERAAEEPPVSGASGASDAPDSPAGEGRSGEAVTVPRDAVHEDSTVGPQGSRGDGLADPAESVAEPTPPEMNP